MTIRVEKEVVAQPTVTVEDDIDFGQFWIWFQKPDGQFTGGPELDDELFDKQYGKGASHAFKTFRDSGRKRESSEDNERLYQQSLAELNKLEIDPEKVSTGKNTKSRIEQLD